ncbi:cobalt-precorrin-6A reductase [Pelagibius sp. Alg239-R121]|uniref:cobalt-precorrin-6A reductase n=1 Tax=Pelagibius sp. Alg239-R121 TaxID=2993448 RepID=UPI0024A739B0|nr:cobalt-precorrin-6A reductase [Pelagibius sp. Alg239-R121]
MNPDKQVLILSGTGEAFALATLLFADGNYRVINSLAGRTKAPVEPPGEIHMGGFGGAEGLAKYLRSEVISAVIDATHPFAVQISRNAFQACNAAQVPYLQLHRPAWEKAEGDTWLPVANLDAAAELIARSNFRRIFLTTGRQEVKPFAELEDRWFLLRSVDPISDLPLKNFDTVLGRGPFYEQAETQLLNEHRIDSIVTKNSGGPATYGKIAAARKLGLPVIVIQRPAALDCNHVGRPADAVKWLKQLI